VRLSASMYPRGGSRVPTGTSTQVLPPVNSFAPRYLICMRALMLPLIPMQFSLLIVHEVPEATAVDAAGDV
jgi:hypothetical protein